jgi:hypothetical protein
MMTWLDFDLADPMGPQLKEELIGLIEIQVCRRPMRTSIPIKDDQERRLVTRGIQETGQESEPARMVGDSSLDSNSAPSLGRDAQESIRTDARQNTGSQGGWEV